MRKEHGAWCDRLWGKLEGGSGTRRRPKDRTLSQQGCGRWKRRKLGKWEAEKLGKSRTVGWGKMRAERIGQGA